MPTSLLVIILLANFFPFFIAMARGHNAKPAIFVSCLLLNWTFIMWAVNLVWACNSNTADQTRRNLGR